MGKLNGPWAIGWVGDTSGCEEYNVVDLKSKVGLLFQTSQSGTKFTIQSASSANSPFASIKKLKCGTLTVFQLNGDANLNHVSQSGASSTARIIPNFPLEIKVENLTGGYADGNGEYIITTTFKNDHPTYKNENNWIIEKQGSFWNIVHDIDNLNFLINNSISPDTGPYKELNCNNDCQVANIASDNNEDGDSTDDDDTNTDFKLPQILNLTTSKIEINSFTITWTGVEDISNYDVEISDSINFNESSKTIVNKNKQFHEFTNLTDGYVYYYRIRYRNYLDEHDGNYIVRKVTTPISGKRFNLKVNLDENYNPKLQWSLPSDLSFDYSYTIKRSTDKQNWQDIKTFKKSESVTHYTDLDVGGKNIYYYSMVFYNGHDGDASSIQEITIDKEKPRKPNLHTIESPTSDKNLVFKWDFIENASYYLYRFNESSWIKITNKTTNVTIPASEGSNVFKIKVVDAFANHSDESESIVIVDTTPPPKPIIAQTGGTTNKKEFTFTWECTASDLKELQYRFNNSSWIRIDKTIASVKIKTVQGQNKFEIKSIDLVGNESEVSTYSVVADFIPPNAPLLNKIESPTKAKKIFFNWQSDDVFGFQYRVTTWTNNSSKQKTPWNNLDKNRRTLELEGKDGFMQFEIKSFDDFGNTSDIGSQTILIDYTPPTIPVLREIDVIPNLSTGKTKVRYQVDFDSSSAGASFRYNDNSWEDFDVKSNDDLEVQFDEGKNTLEIYSFDSVGNQSEIRKIEKFVDNIAPPKPVIVSPLGEAPNELNKDLWKLCQLNSTIDDLQTLNISYSFVSENTPVNFENLEDSSRYEFRSTSTFRTNTVSEYEFKKEIESGFRSFKKIIEDLYDKIEINFINLGNESDQLKKIPVGFNYGLEESKKKELNLADIRIGIVNKTIELNQHIKNPNTDLFAVSNAIIFGKDLSWQPDSKTNSNFYSIQYGLRYYLGKIFGLPKNLENTHGTQHGLEKGKTVKNRESSDKNLFATIYGGLTSNANTTRVVKETKLDINWKTNSSALYEYKYAFISDTGRITSMERWSALNQTESTNGRKLIDVSGSNSSLLRFYVRSTDSVGNESEETYADFKLPEQNLETDIDILSIDTKCETNTQYKFNKNCWDKFGLFSVELLVSNIKLENQHLIVEVKDLEKTFARYVKVTDISNGKIFIDSLEPETNYSFRVVVVSNGEQLVGNGIYNNLVGSYYGEFSKFRTFKTTKSYIKLPSNASIKQIVHYRMTDNENTRFIYPNGESVSLNVWKPTCLFKWNSVNDKFFDNYTIQYSKKDGNDPIKTKLIKDQTQTELKIRLDAYNTTYKFRILVSDAYGNSVSSNWQEYKTVPQDSAPIMIEDFNVFYTGEIKAIYNERPNSKWTLGFKLPKVIDDQFMKGHKVPDVEDFIRRDYNLLDWMSSVRHPPIKIEYKEVSSNSKTVYWMTHSHVYDDDFQKTDLKIKHDKNLGYYIKIPGFEENIKYDFVLTIYDTSGHFVQKTKTVQTKSKPVDSGIVPIEPVISVEKYRYINGKDSSGNSLANVQWILDIIVNLKSSNSVKMFYVNFRTSRTLFYKKFEVNVSNIPRERIWSNGGTTTYTLRISSFNPRTRYYIKVDAVNENGNLSKPSNEVQYVTPVGDTSLPEETSLSSFRRYHVSSFNIDQFQFTLNKSVEPNLDFVLFHEMYDSPSEKPNSIWDYKTKVIIPGSRLKAHWSNGQSKVNINFASNLKKYHSAVFMWRDSAFNYSIPYTKTFDPEIQGQISYADDDIYDNNYEQEENVLVLN